MVSTQSDGVGNLVDALCGRLPASVPVQLPGAQPQRRPGILTEFGRDRGDFGEDTREVARLTEALMNLLPSEGTGASSSRRDTPASAHFKDSMALVAPLILEYDDVTARQYERIVAQDAELDAMRAALETARGEMDAALEAERARDAEVGLLSNRNADYAELSARVLEFDEENGLLREQTGEMATELRRLTVDLEARAQVRRLLRRRLFPRERLVPLDGRALRGVHRCFDLLVHVQALRLVRPQAALHGEDVLLRVGQLRRRRVRAAFQVGEAAFQARELPLRPRRVAVESSRKRV